MLTSTSDNTPLKQKALSLLRRFYGYDSFRPGQWEIISAALAGRDALALMPTGGGKSICYQMTALLSDGCVIVVSPLISLMADQVAALQANGIPAATVNSTQSETANRAVMDHIYAGHIKLLYISPERLIQDLPRLSADLRIPLIAIDEAHCISQWGHDFRPVYTQLAQLKKQFRGIPVMALTATADRITREDIIKQLNLTDPSIYISSFDRPNISLTVIPSPGKRDKVTMISRLIDKYHKDAGIVYCISRKAAEHMAEALTERGYRTAVYHAGLSASQRNEAQRMFTNGDVQAVCATVAFGMGIDKSNIRWVVHNNLPRNIESYYQEIGRAGRDGMPAEAVMFYSIGDIITLKNFVDESGQVELNSEKLQRMRGFAEATVCRRRMLLSYFNEELDHDCGNCDVCKNPPERIDGTTLAQKAMSAAIRAGENVGVTMLIDILRGSARADLIASGYHTLKTYGAGRDLSFAHWNTYIGQMVQLGVFDVAYNESNHLKVTDYGRRILHGQATLTLSKHQPLTAGRQNKRPPETIKLSPDELLIDALKDLRSRLSKREGIPGYMIFSDKTLAEMTAMKPVTLDEFARVEGVSERKLVKYWRPFVKAICNVTGKEPPEMRGASSAETLLLFNQGFTLEQIADIKGVKAVTVYSHFTQLVNDDRLHDFSRLITRPQYLRVMQVREQHPDSWRDILDNELPKGLPQLAVAIADYLLRHKS